MKELLNKIIFNLSCTILILVLYLIVMRNFGSEMVVAICKHVPTNKTSGPSQAIGLGYAVTLSIKRKYFGIYLPVFVSGYNIDWLHKGFFLLLFLGFFIKTLKDLLKLK